uniref:Uncharacterized protein n=1 Tax=Glossina pallidipes TaxID=7398 RepID=A0A1A9ZHS7_GLOPL
MPNVFHCVDATDGKQNNLMPELFQKILFNEIRQSHRKLSAYETKPSLLNKYLGILRYFYRSKL